MSVIVLYLLLFCVLAWNNFKLATGLVIMLLPAYFIRFNLGPLPSTILECSFGALFFVWILRYFKKDWLKIKNFYNEHKILTWFIFLLLSFSTLGIFISWDPVQSLGIWRAYFLEPILFFWLLVGRRAEFKKDDLIWFLSLSTVAVSIVAILQKIFGLTLFTALIKADSQNRVTSFFTSPNAVGLYLGPIIPLAIYGLKNTKLRKYYFGILVLSLITLVLSFSEGVLVALGVVSVGALFLFGYKKIAGLFVLFGIIGVMVISPIQQSLLFKNQSGQNRLTLWSYTWNYLNKNKINFIFGAGLNQFNKKIQRPVNDFKKIEPLIFPHNIILNFWSEIGLFGVIFFISIYLLALKNSYKKSIQNKYFGVALLLCLVIFFIHGLVDVPYFKNDLSFLWWVILAIIFI